MIGSASTNLTLGKYFLDDGNAALEIALGRIEEFLDRIARPFLVVVAETKRFVQAGVIHDAAVAMNLPAYFFDVFNGVRIYALQMSWAMNGFKAHIESKMMIAQECGRAQVLRQR